MTIVDKIRRDGYRNELDKPRSPSEPVIPDLLRSNRLTPLGLVDDYERDLDRYFIALAEWRSRMKAWLAREAEIRAAFDADLLAEFSITDHPRAQQLLAIAWARGGNRGLEAVAQEAVPLASLLR